MLQEWTRSMIFNKNLNLEKNEIGRNYKKFGLTCTLRRFKTKLVIRAKKIKKMRNIYKNDNM